MTYLMDANVLIALVDEAHVHHGAVEAWLAQAGRVATCPITQGALTRYLIRQGQQPAAVQRILTSIDDDTDHEFWPDALPYAEADLSGVTGHQQVTDAYLASLVAAHGTDARLATLDRGLAALRPGTVVLVAERSSL